MKLFWNVNIVWLSAVILIATLMSPQIATSGQSANALANAQRQVRASSLRGLPGDLLVQLQAVGTRLQVPGKEQTVLTGELLNEAGERKSIRVAHQLSGLVRIEGVRERTPLKYDGDLARGSADRMDEALLETFVMDTLEGMIGSARSGGAVRLVGRRFGPDPRTVSKDFKGPYYDIYEVLAPVRVRTDRQLRMKRYYFDSDTGLLVTTRYIDPTVGQGLAIETRFSGWRETAGSAYPGAIERYEDGRRVFSFVVEGAVGTQAQDVSNFR
jgi:hypothetical protein